MAKSFGSQILLPRDPTVALEAATKQYVDAKVVTTAQAEYQWLTATTASDPGSGFLKANNAAPASTTLLYASLYDSNGAARLGVLGLAVGDEFTIYHQSDITKWVKYTVAGTVTLNANVWVTIPVTYVSQASFAPGNNGRIQTSVRSAGSAPPAHADTDHDDRFSLLAHTHAGVYAPVPGAWQSPSFQTGWGNQGGFQTARYRLEGDVVRLEGLVTRSSGSATDVFTLASGYRPAATHSFAVSGNAAFGRVNINNAGLVSVLTGAVTNVQLSGITFAIT